MWNKYSKHFSSLFSIDVNLFDIRLKKFCNFENTFCSRCPRQGDYNRVHLYGCYESIRWDNKYIYYCPMDFTFIAVPIYDEFNLPVSGMIAGPILMGDVSDFEQTFGLTHMDTAKVNDLAEIISAVFSTPAAPRNRDSASEFLSMLHRQQEEGPKDINYPIDVEKQLQRAIIEGNEARARECLNRLLGEIFFRSGGNFQRIKTRALELLVLISRSAIEGGADVVQIFDQNDSYLQQINRIDSLERLNLWLSNILNRFIGYVFEFGDVKHGDIIRKITGYIKDNYMQRITLDDIAERVYMSKSYISRIFNEEMNTSVSAYVNKVRIEKSKHLLADTNLSIMEIANLTGFEDQSYFSKQFKLVTGVSPKTFRQKQIH